MADLQRPAVPTPLLAGTRDASWYDRPDVRTVKAFHIATDIDTAACAPGPEHHSGVVQLADFTYERAENVYDDLRCRRPGCKRHWKTVPDKPRSVTSPKPVCLLAGDGEHDCDDPTAEASCRYEQGGDAR